MRSLRGLWKRVAFLESLPPVASADSPVEPSQAHPLLSETAQKLVEMAEGMPVVVEGLRERIRADGLRDYPLLNEMAEILLSELKDTTHPQCGAMPTVPAPVPVAVADDKDDQIADLQNRIAALKANGTRLPNGFKELL